MNVEIPTTKCFDFLMDLPPNIDRVVLEGSTRSGKTWSILQWLVWKALSESGNIIRCFRYDGSTIARTMIPDFLEIMKSQYKIFNPKSWNKTTLVYSFPNGSKMYFNGLSDAQKLHGMKQDYAFLEEAMECPKDSYTQVAYRTTKMIIFGFNPSLSTHYVFDQIIPLPNCAYSHSTYKDNPFLTQAQIKEIESYNPEDPQNIQRGTADSYLWSVYGLGKRGKIEGAIYPLFTKIPYNQFPQRNTCTAFGYGVDWGFSNDPTALVECRIYNGDLFIKELVFKKGLITQKNPNDPSVPSFQEELEVLGISKSDIIVADSAEPKTISALRSLGYSIVGVIKGKDSVLMGIDAVKRHRIFIEENSQNLLLAMERYKWKKSASGAQLREPDHDFSDLPDAFRYFAIHFAKFRSIGPKSSVAKGSIINRIQGYQPPKKSDGLLNRRNLSW